MLCLALLFVLLSLTPTWCEERAGENTTPVLTFHEVPAAAPPPLAHGFYGDELHAWAFSEATLMRTRDGGRTWFELRPSLDAIPEAGEFGELLRHWEWRARDLWFLSATAGWLSGWNRGFWATTDGGLHWHRQLSLYVNTMAVQGRHGWAYMVIGSEISGYQNYVTDTGGAEWRPCGRKIDRKQPALMYPFFLTPTQGWVITWGDIQRGGIAATTNGGCDWRQIWVDPEESGRYMDRYGTLFMLNSTEGWLGGAYNGSLLHTVDGGHHWEHVKRPLPTLKVLSVLFRSSKVGWLSGGWVSMTSTDSGFFRTEDGGASWIAISIRDIVAGKGLGAIPDEWKDGKLAQMLYRSQAFAAGGRK